MLPIDEGIGPEILFLEKERDSSLDKTPRSAGRVPTRRFLVKKSCTMLVHWDKLEGIAPMKELLLKSRN